MNIYIRTASEGQVLDVSLIRPDEANEGDLLYTLSLENDDTLLPRFHMSMTSAEPAVDVCARSLIAIGELRRNRKAKHKETPPDPEAEG